MRQDNGIKIFNYNGELIYQEDIPELFSAHWRPQSPDIYPIGNLIPPNPEATKIPPLAAPKPYRHPNFSGATASPPTTTQTKAPTRYTPTGQTVRPKGTLVGGELDDTPIPEPIKSPPKKYTPPQGTPNLSPIPINQPIPSSQNITVPMNQPNTNIKPIPISNPNQPYRKDKSPRGQSQKGPGGYKNNSEQIPKEKSFPPSHTPVSESEKRRRTLIKKLREIQTLKERQAAGETLNPAQETKIASEAKFQSELDSLPKSENTEGKSPRHYKFENKSPRQYKTENNSEVKNPRQ